MSSNMIALHSSTMCSPAGSGASQFMPVTAIFASPTLTVGAVLPSRRRKFTPWIVKLRAPCATHASDSTTPLMCGAGTTRSATCSSLVHAAVSGLWSLTAGIADRNRVLPELRGRHRTHFGVDADVGDLGAIRQLEIERILSARDLELHLILAVAQQRLTRERDRARPLVEAHDARRHALELGFVDDGERAE